MATRRLRSRPRSRPADETPPEETTVDAKVEPTSPGLPVLQMGRRIGRYRLCGELASGGMAAVHIALLEGAAGFEKVVALKEIHPHLAKKQSFVEMFLDEA
ncbi:MAG: hypothetical protein AAGF12_29555, partial [Myxococcota bacterium]